MPVPLLDLGAQIAPIRREIDAAIARVIDSNQFVLGPEVTSLEQEIADYLGASDAIGVSSGTDALLLAMMALDIGPGDEVILPTFSFFATAGTVVRIGATPVFADIDPVTYNIEPDAIEALVTERTAAIIPVHLFGRGAAMRRIEAIAESHNIPIIEDAAQAIGAVDEEGRGLGTIGQVGCFSFFPTKNLGAFGDAGIVVTSDSDLADRMRLLRVHGAAREYRHDEVGGNFRIDAIQAAVLRVKLPHLESWSEGRRRNAALYREKFFERGLSRDGALYPDNSHPVALPASPDGSDREHIYNQFVLRVERRDELIEHLRSAQIGHSVYYPVPFHHQPCFEPWVPDGLSLPHAERASNEVIALPIFGELTEGAIDEVVSVVEEFFGGGRSEEEAAE